MMKTNFLILKPDTLLSKIMFTFLLVMPALLCRFEVYGEREIYDKIGIDVRHGLHGAVPEENIDLFTGNLTLRNLDIVLPGPNGFDLKVWRVYNSKIVRDRLAVGSWELQQDPYSSVGIGWSMHMGRLHNVSGDEPVIEFPDGRWETAYIDLNNTASNITRDFLKYDRAAYKLYFKDGVVWTFGASAMVNTGGNIQPVRMVTRIENAYGHFMTVDYVTGTANLQRITDSMSRQVNFTVINNKLTKIAVKNSTGQTIYYNYTVQTFPGGYHKLTAFDAPEIPAVTYEYENGLADKYKLTGINTAFGGRMEYVYEDHTFYYMTFSLQTRVVKQKKIRFGSSGSFYTWNYSYPSYYNTPTGQVTVDGPVYDTEVTYHAYSASTPWKLGLIKTKEFSDGSFSQETQWEAYRISWSTWLVLNQNMGYIQAPRVSKTITTRVGDATAVEEYKYERSGVEKYGLPTGINYYGGTSGTTFLGYKALTYYFESNSSFLSKYMLTPLKKESIYDGSTKVKETENAYYASTGKYGALDWVKRWRGDTTLTWDYSYSSSNPNNITITINLPGSGGTESYNYRYGVLSELKRPGYTEFTRSISAHNSAVLWETNQHGGRMDFTYDDLDRIERVDMPAGFNDVTAVWSTNQVTIKQNNNSVIKFWDGMGRDTGSQESGDGTTLYFRKGLDAEGRLLNENKGSTNAGHKYNYVMNNMGSVTKITDPRGKITNITYSGYTKKITDAEQKETVFEFQHLPGKISRMKDAEGRYAVYTYDGVGRLKQVVYNSARTQSYTYDGLDQLKTENHPETDTITYTYNADNNLYTKKWDNKIITYTYNASNQLTKLDAYDEDVDYTYDSSGRVSKVDGSTGWYRDLFTYNSLGSVTRERQYTPGLGSLTMTYGYDGNNNLDSVQYPNNKTLTVGNNSLNMPETASFNGKSLVSRVSYGINKHPVSMTISGNGTDFTAAYNSMGFLDYAQLKKGAVTHYRAYYGYDNVGNITSIYNTVPALNGTFVYDDLYRLTSASYSGGNSYTYDHDQYGNLTQAKVNGTTAFSRSYTSKNRINHSSFIYDNRGNLTRDPKYLYVRDRQNRLMEVKTLNGETTSTHLYDDRGLRLKSNRVASPSLTVTYPQGGETVLRGADLSITWTGTGFLADTVKITLVQNGADLQQITAGALTSAGLFVWTIPDTLAEGGYTIRLTDGNDTASADSAAFTVSGSLTLNEFTEVTGSPVVQYTTNSMDGTWGDYDNDGDPDLLVSNYNQQNHLFSNNGGNFTRVANSNFDTTSQNSRGVSWGDFNNDGFPDIYTANEGEDNQLFKYNGSGQFQLESTASDGGDSYSAAWMDYDSNGLPDLYVANHQGGNFLYRGDGSGGFMKISGVPIVTDSGFSRNARWCDHDNDGHPDLYVVNYGGNNALYRNNGNGSFDKITGSAVTSDGGNSNDCAWGDYDNDLDMDLFVANGDGENNFLYRNNGNGSFTRIEQGDIVGDGGDSIACRWLDMDNDGDPDLLVVNINQANFIYQNNGDGTFTRIDSLALAAHALDSRGVGVGDYDQDGDNDVYISNYGVNSLFSSNAVGNGNGWLTVKCVGTVSNAGGLGAKVKVKRSGSSVWQVREINDRYGLVAHFGLGAGTGTADIVVQWPSGQIQSLSNQSVDRLLTITEPIIDTISVISPNGGEFLVTGTAYPITWTSTGAVGNVSIQYTTDDGATWNSINSSTANDGSYTWTVPMQVAATCRVRVSDGDGSPSDESDALFSIVPPPSLGVTSPNGGESLEVGSVHTITWTSAGMVGNVTIQFSHDDGVTWETIMADTADDGSYDWTVPAQISDLCRVRVSENDGDPTDVSDAVFAVVPVPALSVTSPNGGENLEVGSVHPVTWISVGAVSSVVTIQYTIDNGTSWNSISASTDNDGRFDWTVPAQLSDACRVRVSDGDADPTDESDALFSIVPVPALTVTSPNGGENLEVDSIYTITWTSEGIVNNVSLQFSVNNGSTWNSLTASTSNDGSYDWTVPDLVSDSCRVRIFQSSDGEPADESDALFSIVPIPAIRVTSPNGGENFNAGSLQTISWTSEGLVGAVTIQYTADGGESWTEITGSTANDGLYAWTLPAGLSDRYLVRVMESDGSPADVSDGEFSLHPPSSIAITAPNGGENWDALSGQIITWTSAGSAVNVSIDYSTDNGASWTSIVSTTPNDGSYAWTLPDTPPSMQCLVRVSPEDMDTDPPDVSDMVFTISADAALCGTVWRNGDYSGNSLYSVAYGNSVFVAVGADGEIVAGTDAIHWSGQPAPTPHTLRGIAFGDGLFAAVGDNGTILTGAGGIDWTVQDSGSVSDLYAVTYGNHRFTAVGAGGRVLSSTDGINWMEAESVTNFDLHCTVFGNGLFVAAGAGGTVISSSDGVSWFLQSSGVGDALEARLTATAYLLR